jgi:hypothetical protein
MRKSWLVAVLFTAGFPLCARQDLSAEQLKLLQDPGGWEYLLISDRDAGIQTQHTCFDGHPHPKECSGTLVLKPQNTFVQQTFIHHQRVSRHGTYQLNGNQLSFFDESGTQDGPYTITLSVQNKTLTLDNPPVHIGLELHSRYVADRQAKRAPAP